ncbi:MAG: hypothetical protein OEZ34_00470 [Spirochaetia bacterium]|nr:hypothetical protein [Spirochaetia bacterium]
MGIVKVTVFQKSLHEGPGLATVKKLSGIKSNFLIFPEFFFSDDKTADYRKLEDKSSFALDWLLKLNESYKGIIIGGTMFYAENGQKYIATPIITGGEVIDWYKKRKLKPEEGDGVLAGEDCGEYILGGHRFSILSGEEVYDPALIHEIAEKGIHFVIAVSNSYRSSPDSSQSDEDNFCQPAKQHGISFVKCAASGSFLGKELQGRSLAVAPSGISWRVSESEEQSELIKTVLINI